MKRCYLCIIVLIILLTSSLVGARPLAQSQKDDTFGPLTKTTIYVDDSNTQGPWNGSYEHPYQYITEGILHATDGDTVYVFNGLYNETILLNKSIYFRGQQQENTIIDGQNTGLVISVTSDNVNIRKFTIRNSGGYEGNAGIAVFSNTTTITECTIYRTRTGILVQNQSETIITSSRFHTNGYGILFSASAFVTIDYCMFYHNGIGAYLYETYCITITNSYTDTNGIGFLCERSSNIHISESAARDNDDNEGGMFFVDCSYVNIINCYLVNNGVGVNLVNSSACYIDRCNFSFNTHFACKLKEAVSSIILTNCIFAKNLRYGIYSENSAFTISWSNLYKNENYGLYAKSSAITASYNWWGSKNGPAHTGLTKADRGTWSPREITYAAWLTFPMPDIGPNWDLDKTFQKPAYSNPWPEHITFPDLDTDGDGAPDWWEVKWGYNPTVREDHQHLDPDNDSLNNIEECYMDYYGSNPFIKDVFLEFDWTKTIQENATNKPPVKEVTQMIDAFARHNITLHVDSGELGGGEELPSQAYVSFAEIITLYWDYFLHNDLNNPRQRIFHYGIICDYSEGPGFSVFGWDHLNAFIVGAQFLAEVYPFYTRGWLSMSASMHETGHTFGLVVTKYKGIDNRMTINPVYKEFWIYLPYKSILSYLYTYSFMDFSDGSHGPQDYNDWGNLDFSFFKNTNFSSAL
ncbi:MAG TPA: right-handed parallel beta-helix repeat-containing protein [Candidatus Thermoplasmatota archaeon]|nr:right-handed parallel beta-helix repeat-containing protein [Candidatus Thermoplasmatota archaeon]